MYHEMTYTNLQKRRKAAMRALLLAVLACAITAVLSAYAGEVLKSQGAATLRQAVISSALQCCAVEGSFPTSVDHLTQHYGLVINEEDYQVQYEWLGDNITPSVVVTPL